MANFVETKEILNELIDTNYKAYIKALISIEFSIDDEIKLNMLYERYMNDDDMQLLNLYLEEI